MCLARRHFPIRYSVPRDVTLARSLKLRLGLAPRRPRLFILLPVLARAKAEGITLQGAEARTYRRLPRSAL
jgi:hypothetical protein